MVLQLETSRPCQRLFNFRSKLVAGWAHWKSAGFCRQGKWIQDAVESELSNETKRNPPKQFGTRVKKLQHEEWLGCVRIILVKMRFNVATSQSDVRNCTC